MLRLTVDINGRKIGQVGAINISGDKSGVNTYHIYDVSSVAPGESVTEQGTKIGEVEHRYEDGAAILSKKVLDEIGDLP